MPQATWDGLSFSGWYTEATGGVRITTETVFTENTTVYAHWYGYELDIKGIMSDEEDRMEFVLTPKKLHFAEDESGKTISLLRMACYGGTLVNEEDNSKTIPFTIQTSGKPELLKTIDFTNENDLKYMFAYIDPNYEIGVPAGVGIKGAAVEFQSNNSFRLYLKFDGSVAPENYDYFVNGEATMLKTSGEKYFLTVRNVIASKLGDEFTFTISRGEESYDVTVSVLSYARSCLLKGGENLQNLAKALYLYNQTAIEKFKK